MFVVDPTSARSVNFFRRTVECVPPLTPVLVVVNKRIGGPPGKTEGERIIEALCRKSDKPVDLTSLPAAEPASSGSGASLRMADDDGGREPPADKVPCGLNVPVFAFIPNVSVGGSNENIYLALAVIRFWRSTPHDCIGCSSSLQFRLFPCCVCSARTRAPLSATPRFGCRSPARTTPRTRWCGSMRLGQGGQR